MVEDEVRDGRRIAELLSSELDGRTDGILDRFAVVNPDREVEGSVEGERAYDVAWLTEDGGDGKSAGDQEAAEDQTGAQDEDTAGDETGAQDDDGPGGRIVARVFVHADRVRLEVYENEAAVADAAADLGLRVRPTASRPPKTVVFVENGAAVKRAVTALQAGFRE